MTTKQEPTGWVKLYLSGPIEVAKQVLRKECLRIGLCVTIEPTSFIYTGGEEAGYVVGLVNYPRFPKPQSALDALGRELGQILLEKTYQQSVLVMTPETTTWITTRTDPSTQ